MMWHIVFAEPGGMPQSRAVRSREEAIQIACELLDKAYDVRRVIEPSGRFIDRAAALIKRPLLNSVSRKMKREEGRCALPAPESP